MKCDYAEYLPVMKALADTTRMRIVDILSGGETCACEMLEEFNITQPTLSYHMKILTGCGIVESRRDGAWIHYRLNNERVDAWMAFVSALMQQQPTGRA